MATVHTDRIRSEFESATAAAAAASSSSSPSPLASVESVLNNCAVAADAALLSPDNVFEHAADAETPSGECEAYHAAG
jgi:hypothetical protein